MAVTMNSSGMRADFMISDAALPQRMAELMEDIEAQEGMFSRLLTEIGGAKVNASDETAVSAAQTVGMSVQAVDSSMQAVDTAVQAVDTAVQAVDSSMQAVDAALEADDVVTLDMSSSGEVAAGDSPILPDDPQALAMMVLRGEVKLKDIPADKLTPKLIKLLMLMRKSGEYNKDDKGKDDDTDDGEQDRQIFDPVKAIATEQMFQQSLQNSVLNELYQILEKQNEDKDKPAIVEGVFETTETAETLPSITTTDKASTIGESTLTAMIDNLVATVAEGRESAETQQPVEETAKAVPNVENVGSADLIIPSDNADAPEVFMQNAVNVFEPVNVAQTVEAPTSETVQTEAQTQLTDVQNVTVQAAVSQNEQTAETAVSQNVPVEEFTVRTVKAEKPEIAENAVQQQEVVEPIAVKTVTRNENVQQLDKTAEQDPVKEVEHVTEKATEQVPEKTVELDLGKAVEQAPEKVVEQAPEKVVALAPEKVAEQVTEKAVEQAPEKVIEQVPVKAVEQVTEKAVERVPEKLIEQSPVKAVEQVPEKVVEQVPENVVKQAPVKTVEQASEKAVEQVSDEPVDKVPEKNVERNTEKTVEAKPVKFVLKTSEQPIEKNAVERPRTSVSRFERVKSATDELEMLRSAKFKANSAEEKLGHTAQPLNVDSPIVFKKEDGSEIEVRPSEILSQTAKLVQKAITENDDKTEYSMVLNPEDLGKITVKLTKAADGAVSVTIMAENARTQRIIEQHSDLMQSNLRSDGVNLESWQTVGERQQEHAAQDYNGSSKNPYYRNDNNDSEDNSDGEMSFADLIASM